MSSEEQLQIAALKSKVFRLEAQVKFLYDHLGLTFVEDIHPVDDPKVIAALKAGNEMEAIKAYRLSTNAGLVEAKAAVEEIRARIGI